MSCSSPPLQPTEVPATAGMVKIASKGTTIQIGSLDKYAADDEKPPMSVSFSYNFEIDTTEVTCEQYYTVMRMLPKEYPMVDSASRKPVCFVSWFDAVLYCNAKSHSQGLDTVYRYASSERTLDGRTYRLSALSADLSCSGYRLPTEAEWEFCARTGTPSSFPWGDAYDTLLANNYAWSIHNSGNTAQNVATRYPNNLGIYDLAGNALEWVHDWKVLYQSDVIADFCGGNEAGNGLRPVKGGSFAHILHKLRPSSRSDTYATISSTAFRYLGFRCCRGAIPHPSYLASKAVTGQIDSSTLSVINVNPLAAETGLKAVCVISTGSRGMLCGIDLSGFSPRIFTYSDIPDPHFPTISPDGRWVAFCTADEGAIDGSEIYIRKLDAAGSELVKLDDPSAFIPRWWVDPQSSDTFIVYTTSAVLNTMLSWQQTATKMQKIAGGKPAGSATVLEANGSFHGGLSVDKRYLATGYPLLKMKDLSTGEAKTLFTAPFNGKSAGDTSQVCNLSISPDPAHPDRVLFLDFGSGSKVSSLTKSTYDTHALLFMADFSGTVNRWFACPPGGIEWDCPEWTNKNRFAVACVKTAAEPSRRSLVYLVDLEDSIYTQFLSGRDIKQPYVWIADSGTRPHGTFSPDSAGLYNEPPAQIYQSILAEKMPLFWKFIDTTEVLFLGSSRMEAGGAPGEIDSHFALNMAYSGCGLLGSRRILEDYALRHGKKLKAVIMSLDICWFSTPGGDETWLTGTENTIGYIYDRHHDFWSQAIPEGFIGHVTKDIDGSLLLASRGWNEGIWSSNGWGPETLAIPLPWAWGFDDNALANSKTISTMAELCQDNGILLIGVLFPMSPHFTATTVYGSFGPSREAASRIIAELKEVDASYPGFLLYDANASGDHNYTFEEFHDESHLSAQGGIKISRCLNDIVVEYLRK